MKYPEYQLLQKEGVPRREHSTELSASELEELCECARYVGKQAAEVLLDVYLSSTDFDVQTKSDQTPVTKADFAADEVIRSLLRESTRFPIVTEEHPLDISERKDRKSVWLVDPLDGTQNFINRDGQFSVLIALLHFNVPLVGMVYVPQTQECFAGYYQGGAIRYTQDSAPEKIRHAHQHRALKAVLSSLPSEAGRKREEAFCAANNIKKENIFRVGSSLKLARLAQGEYDCTVRFDTLSEWDTAAADCLLREADCRMSDVLTAEAIQYNQNTGFSLPGYLVTRGDYHFEVLS